MILRDIRVGVQRPFVFCSNRGSIGHTTTLGRGIVLITMSQIGSKVVGHARDIAMPGNVFADGLRMIAEFAAKADPTPV